MTTSRGLGDEGFVYQVAVVLRRRGWHLPVLVALEAGRPFALLGGQLLWVLEPVLGIAFPRKFLHQMACLLEDRSALDRLIDHLGSDVPLEAEGQLWD